MPPAQLIPTQGPAIVIAAAVTLVVVLGTLLLGLRAERKRPRDIHEEH